MWLSGSSGALPAQNLMPTYSGAYNTASNRLTAPAYDAAGNQQSFSTYTLTYDAENRQTKASDSSSGETYTYAYDGLGARVSKTAQGVTTSYVHDAFGNLTAEYTTQAPVDQPCTTCYLSWDHLGSTRLVTDSGGVVVARHDFLPFGQEIAGGLGGRNDLWGQTDQVTSKFTSQEHDVETGIDFFQARYQANQQGRFLSADPGQAGADPGNPQSWNGYGYVGNNPINATDPSGMHIVDCVWDGCSPFGIGGGGGGGGVIIDGVEQTTFNTSGLGSNGLAACPNNFCNGFAPVGNGNVAYVQYTAPASGPGSYTAVSTPIPDPSLPQNQAYAAYLLDCQHSSTPCSGGENVTTRYQGLAGNYALVNSTLNSASVTGMIPDPSITSNIMHGGPSWYDWSLVGTGHVATNPYGEVESHFDTFSPIFLTPLHFLFDVLPSFFINRAPGVTGPSYTCTPGVGCH
jgi:RHS repeat-associated protein